MCHYIGTTWNITYNSSKIGHCACALSHQKCVSFANGQITKKQSSYLITLEMKRAIASAKNELKKLSERFLITRGRSLTVKTASGTVAKTENIHHRRKYHCR